MRKTIILALALSAAFSHSVAAQEVVIDPTMIASAAANSAEQIEYMIEQISRLDNLEDKIGSIRGYVDEVFPGDGDKIISLLKELGTLEDLSKAYSRSIQITSWSISTLKSINPTNPSDITTLLDLIRKNQENTRELLNRSRGILHQGGFTKMEKKQQIESICQKIESNTREIEDIVLLEKDVSLSVDALSDFLSTASAYTLGKDNSSSAKEGFTLKGFTRLLSTILMLLGIFSLMWGYKSFLQGDSTVYIRIACGVLCGVIFLGVLSKLFNI